MVLSDTRGFEGAGVDVSEQDIEHLAFESVAARTGFDCCFAFLLLRGNFMYR
jgi:hypothetical protein